MTTACDPLPTDLETCHQLIRELLETLRQQTHLNEKLQHQLEQLLRRLYGQRAEQLDPDQLLLFAREILEAGGDAATTDPATPPASPRRAATAATPARRPRPQAPAGPSPPQAGRPRCPRDQKTCPDCGTQRLPIGEEVREQLEYIPAVSS